GTDGVTPQQNDAEHLFPVSIGTRPREFWVTGQTLCDPKKSSTSKQIADATFNISYIDGAVCSGDVYLDVVGFGNLPRSVTHAIEAAINVSQDLTTDAAMSGIFGFGFGTYNTIKPDPQPSFFKSFIPTLKAPVFTIDLKRNGIETLNFGFLGYNAWTGPITYVPLINGAEDWVAGFSGYTVAGSGIHQLEMYATIDSGTGAILLDKNAVDDYYSHISGAWYDDFNKGKVFPCKATVPDFTLHLSEDMTNTRKNLTIPGDYLRWGEISTPFSSSRRGNCLGGIQIAKEPGNLILGDMLLKSVFAVFDVGDRRIGFADK
ncbi:aspartic peptidase domain-containing protein, partial [Immersiella caudata]